METVYVYPDGTITSSPIEWMSDDYEVRLTDICNKCGQYVEPHYGEPFASCDCCTQEWSK